MEREGEGRTEIERGGERERGREGDSKEEITYLLPLMVKQSQTPTNCLPITRR